MSSVKTSALHPHRNNGGNNHNDDFFFNYALFANMHSISFSRTFQYFERRHQSKLKIGLTIFNKLSAFVFFSLNDIRIVFFSFCVHLYCLAYGAISINSTGLFFGRWSSMKAKIWCVCVYDEMKMKISRKNYTDQQTLLACIQKLK